MRVLILSDIHANIDALEAVLEAAPAHDTVWNLGDTVGYGASPNESIERVRNLGAVFVRGNHDRACCGLMSLEDFNPIATPRRAVDADEPERGAHSVAAGSRAWAARSQRKVGEWFERRQRQSRFRGQRDARVAAR